MDVSDVTDVVDIVNAMDAAIDTAANNNAIIIDTAVDTADNNNIIMNAVDVMGIASGKLPAFQSKVTKSSLFPA